MAGCWFRVTVLHQPTPFGCLQHGLDVGLHGRVWFGKPQLYSVLDQDQDGAARYRIRIADPEFSLCMRIYTQGAEHFQSPTLRQQGRGRLSKRFGEGGGTSLQGGEENIYDVDCGCFDGMGEGGGEIDG